MRDRLSAFLEPVMRYIPTGFENSGCIIRKAGMTPGINGVWFRGPNWHRAMQRHQRSDSGFVGVKRIARQLQICWQAYIA